MYDTAIYIAAPGMHAHLEKDIAFLRYVARDVVRLGNGRDTLHGYGKDLSKDLSDILQRLSPGSLLVYVSAHGSVHQNRHYILTSPCQFGSHPDNRHIFYTESLCKIISSVARGCIEIIFFPCAARNARSDIHYLPDGSGAVLCEGYADPHAVRAYMMKDIHTGKRFNLNYYFDHLLLHLTYYTCPIFVIAGGNTHDPVCDTAEYLGRIIPFNLRQKVVDHFIKYLGIQVSRQYLNTLMDKIELNSGIEWSMPRDSLLTEGFLHAGVWIESHCPRAVPRSELHRFQQRFKTQLDAWLYEQKLPFEMDIKSGFWQQKMSEIQPSITDWTEYNLRIPEIATVFSDRACVERLSDLGLKLKSGVSLPSRPAFGHVLCIVRFLRKNARGDTS